MSNERPEGEINEVLLNGSVLMTTRGDTVEEENLLEDESATDSAGRKIVGLVPPIEIDDALSNESTNPVENRVITNALDDKADSSDIPTKLSDLENDMGFATDAYSPVDEAGTLDDADYIPFNDVSDTSKPKKKALFSTIIDKLKNTFLVKSWGHMQLVPQDEYLYIKDTQVDATKANNDISGTHYPSSDRAVDKNGKTMTAYETVVETNGKISAKMYASNYNTSGNSVGQNQISASVDKSGNYSYTVTDPNKFREAIKTVDQYGTTIPNNSNINDYKTAGTYSIGSNASAGTMTNLPIARAGKLIVMCNTASQYITQFFIPFDAKQGFPYYRSYNGDGSVWRQWVSIAESTHLLTNEVRDLAGHIILYTDDLNNFTNSGTYQYSYDSNGMPSNAPNFGVIRSFKLIVDRYGADSRSEIMQTITMINKTNQGLWWRVREWDSSTWGSWYHVANTSDITPANVGNGYAVATVSGSAITATITGFQLRVGVIVAIAFPSAVTTDATLNINNTGAKYIRYWNGEALTYGKGIEGSNIWTFIYDGTYYRILSENFTPTIAMQNHVNDTRGNIIMNWGHGTNRAQIKYNVGDNQLKWNYYKNSAWNGDLELTDIRNSVTRGQVDIPSNADLNNYTACGSYRVASQTIANSLSNAPIQLSGKLLVIAITSNNDTQMWKTQVYLPNHTNQIFTRATVDDNGTVKWLPWAERTSSESLNSYARFNALNLFPWDLVTDIFYNNTDTTHTLTDGVVNVTFNSSANNKGVYIHNYFINQMLSEFHGRKLILSSDIKFDSGSHSLSMGLDNTNKSFTIGTDWVHTEVTVNFDSSLTNNHWHWYTNDSGNLVFHVKNLMVRPAEITSVSNYYPFTFSNQQAVNALGASVAKEGKNILPSWSYRDNERQHNGITYTYNPLTGKITVNGTATADSNCVLAGQNVQMPYDLPKGQYILSGCPKNGAGNTYCLVLEITKSNGAQTSYSDYGRGNIFTTDMDGDSYYNSTIKNYYIFIKSGTTVSNIVFEPMLRPYGTTGEYEPCEDIHKGNCFIGTCKTAGATKDKVAYVDGYFKLRKGVRVAIKFINTNTYSSATANPVTLNVNNTGAKNIWCWSTHSGAGNTGVQTWIYGVAGRYFYYVFDGDYWIYDGCSGDNNSTNFLRNDASSTLTASGAWLALKASNIDAKLANNGITATQYPAYIIQDKNANTLTRLESIVETNGNINAFWYVRNYDTSGNSKGTKGIKMTMNKSGVLVWEIDSADRFAHRLGFVYAECSTAESTTAKVVTQENYRLVYGGIVVIKFDNAVPANSTLNINNQGAKNIYYRGSAIKAGIIRAGDLATFIYDGTQYNLIGTDSQDIKFDQSDITVISSINKTSNLVEGNLNGNQLFCRIELVFKPTADISLTSSDMVFIFNNMLLTTTNGFGWQDIQAYIGYTDMRPMVITNSNNKMGIRFRSNQTFRANTSYTLRLNFTTTAVKI